MMYSMKDLVTSTAIWSGGGTDSQGRESSASVEHLATQAQTGEPGADLTWVYPACSSSAPRTEGLRAPGLSCSFRSQTWRMGLCDLV